MARPHLQRVGLNTLASGPQIHGAVWIVSMSADVIVVDLGLDPDLDMQGDEDWSSGSGSAN